MSTTGAELLLPLPSHHVVRTPFCPMHPTERSATQLLSQSPGEELDERCAEVAWGAGMCGLTIARYLTEHVTSLPLGVMARLVSSNDTIMALLPLVDHPPWVRTVKGQVRGDHQAS